MTGPEIDGEELMRRMITVLQEHFSPMRESLLDGTSSCRRCAALVLRENEQRHEDWHLSLNKALTQLAGGMS